MNSIKYIKMSYNSINFNLDIKKIILIIIFLLPYLTMASGGYDNGTATGKGKFQLDLTWNPFDKIESGQTYAVISYGITNRLDLHGYISHHIDSYQTVYGGLFYQFLDTKRLDIATAIGIRKRSDKNWTDLFMPQLLYTVHITDRSYLGGSFVNITSKKSETKNGTAIDVGIFYKLKYETKRIESIAIGVGGFHPATWQPDSFFLPTYSIDIKFRK